MYVGTVGVVQCASFVDNSPGQLLVAHFCLCRGLNLIALFICRLP